MKHKDSQTQKTNFHSTSVASLNDKSLSARIQRYGTIRFMIETLAALFIMLLIYLVIMMNINQGSFWFDEALFVHAFIQPGVFISLDVMQDHGQAAPLIYMAIVKGITLIFGTSEHVFRAFSLITYVLTILASAYFLKNVIKFRYPLLGAACVGNIPMLLRYSAELKPYMSDAFFVLLVLIVYYWYCNKKLNLLGITIAYAVLLWTSNPSCFMIAAVIAMEMIFGLIHKDQKKIINTLVMALVVMVSFIVNYFLWLVPLMASGTFSAAWEGSKVKLFLSNMDDVKLMLNLSKEVLREVCYHAFPAFFRDTARIIVTALSVGSIVTLFERKRNPYIMTILLSFLIVMIASSLGFYPVAKRLFIYSYPLIIILALHTLRWIVTHIRAEKLSHTMMVLIMVFILVCEGGFIGYWGVHTKGYSRSLSSSIRYISENIQENEKVYVLVYSSPIFEYEVGSDSSIGNYENNVMLGNLWAYTSEASVGVVKTFEDLAGVYLISPADSIDSHLPLLQAMSDNGYLEVVQEQNDSTLFFYTSSLENVKTNIAYELVSIDSRQDTDECSITVRIHNIGDAYLFNTYEGTVFSQDDESMSVHANENDLNKLDTVFWVINRDGDQENTTLQKIDKNIAPGQAEDYVVEFVWGDEERIELGLYRYDQYWFDELGIQPLVIERPDEQTV